MVDWLVREGRSEPIGPVSTELVIRGILAGRVAQDAEVCRVGDSYWRPLATVPEFAGYAFDEDGETHVTDSPWFMEQAKNAGHAPPARPPALPELGLAAPVRRPPPTAARAPAPPPAARVRAPPAAVRAPAPPSRGFAPPPPSTLESTAVIAGQNAYDADDDAETRVADSSQFIPRAPGFEVDDQTMTHVAANPPPAAQLAGPAQVRPTLPMPAKLEPTLDRPIPSPRPAAGAPPAAALAPPPSDFTGIPPGAFPVPPQAAALAVPDYSQPPVQPIAPDYSQPPAQPIAPEYPPPYYTGSPPGAPQFPYAPPPPARPEHDQGLRALVALILFLAVALAVVLVLLVVRR